MPDSSATCSSTVRAGSESQHLGERRGERGLVDDRLRPGVGEEVEQLLGDVAIVHVERCDPRLERAEHRFEVLVAVVEVDREVVLARLVSGELSTLDDLAEAPVQQRVREASRAVVDLGPRQSPVAEDDALSIGDRGGDCLMGSREVEIHRSETKRLPRTARIESTTVPRVPHHPDIDR